MNERMSPTKGHISGGATRDSSLGKFPQDFETGDPGVDDGAKVRQAANQQSAERNFGLKGRIDSDRV